MPGVTHRVAPEGARLAASTRESAWLTPEEIAAARQAKEGVGNPLPPTPAAVEPAPCLPIAAVAASTPSPAAPAVTTTLPAAPATLAAHVVAEMCADAGAPELILPMLQSPMTLEQVEDRLENARLILQCGSMVGSPELSRQLMAAGVPVATARMLILEAKARADAAIVTDPTITYGAAPVSNGRINSAGVYERLNKAIAPGNRQG